MWDWYLKSDTHKYDQGHFCIAQLMQFSNTIEETSTSKRENYTGNLTRKKLWWQVVSPISSRDIFRNEKIPSEKNTFLFESISSISVTCSKTNSSLYVYYNGYKIIREIGNKQL